MPKETITQEIPGAYTVTVWEKGALAPGRPRGRRQVRARAVLEIDYELIRALVSRAANNRHGIAVDGGGAFTVRIVGTEE